MGIKVGYYGSRKHGFHDFIMTKEPDRSVWEDSYNNKALSGIEFKDHNGKLVNFIVVKHDEILEKNRPHRITIRLNENAEPILPPPRTFEEIIQAKRRQQMILYGSGSSSSAALSERVRRVAAAARQRVSAAAANVSRRSIASNRRCVNPIRSTNRNRSRTKSRSRKKARPALVSSPDGIPSTSKTTTAPINPETHEPEQNDPAEPSPGTSSQVFTSLKDLNKFNPLFKSVDTKEVKLLLKSAPPGASIVLPNGTVIKKSRRGGARVGAGRKRSRPYPTTPGQASTSRSSNGSFPPQASSNSSFSSQA